jgi:hypothetical protein
MSIRNDVPSAAGLPTEVWERVEAILKSFEQAWQRGERPSVADYLPAGGAERRLLVVELAHEDLEYRLQAGEAARVEDYLSRYHELASDREAVLGLIAAEYELRRREPDCEAAEYRRRFPEYVADLPVRLQTPRGSPRGWGGTRRRCRRPWTDAGVMDLWRGTSID